MGQDRVGVPRNPVEGALAPASVAGRTFCSCWHLKGVGILLESNIPTEEWLVVTEFAAGPPGSENVWAKKNLAGVLRVQIWTWSKSLALILSPMEQQQQQQMNLSKVQCAWICILTYNFGFCVADEWREPIGKPLWLLPISCCCLLGIRVTKEAGEKPT